MSTRRGDGSYDDKSKSERDPGGTVTVLTTDREQTPAFVLLVIGEGTVDPHPLPNEGVVAIGRSDKNDVRIDEPSISREHARLYIGDGFELEDLESANGTRIRGEALSPHTRTPVEPGQMIEVGSWMVVIQRARPTRTPRRLWPHGYFEARLDDECARARERGSSFAVLRVHVEGEESISVREAVTAALKSSDVVASYAPGEYEILLSDATQARANHVAARIRAETEERRLQARIGIACFPLDGKTPDALASAAGAALRGTKEAAAVAGELVIEEPAMRDLVTLLERVARGTISVLLQGETGVGKEVFAKMVHDRSPRRERPFVAINCAALTESLAESELFGHEKGAFTGATGEKKGLLEAADGGTVFLDELGEMPLNLQAKMLRAIQEKQVTRVGATAPRKIDVRFVSATNRDLEEEIAAGKFRQDLFFRLNGMTLQIPPLRERAAEIPRLAQMFLEKVSADVGCVPAPEISARALALLENYSWPGNVRELANTIERAVLLSMGDSIEPEHLPIDKMNTTWEVAPSAAARQSESAGVEDEEWLSPADRKDRQRILEALEQCNGNQTRAAEMLGIPRRTFTNKLEKYGVPRPRKPR